MTELVPMTGELEMARGILRKIVHPEQHWEQHYFDAEDGVIDIRVHFTADEIAYLNTFKPFEEDQ